MADNNETEAEEVIGCYKVNAVKHSYRSSNVYNRVPVW